MAWFTQPQTGASILTLTYDMSLHLEEIRGGFVLTWLHRQNQIQQWSLNTPSLYEARARSMEIIHDALRETARYLTSSLPVIAYQVPRLDEVTACMPKFKHSCPPCEQECECKPPTHKYAYQGQY
jgi:hypothetical protein